LTQSATEKLEKLFAPFDRSDAPGCTVIIARDSEPIFRKAYGFAGIEQGLANRPTTVMPVGSIAKQFTCAALLLLEAEGVLALDEPVGRWLPELSIAQQAPTLKQLMQHRGGVRCYLDQWMMNGYRTLPAGLPWAIQARQQSLDFAPGSRSSYSNGGYLMLTKVIERASSLTFGGFVRRRLLAPAGMHATSFPERRTSALPGSATAYMKGDAGWTPALQMTEEGFGDGGLFSSADDLQRWARFLRRSTGPASLAHLAAPDEPWAPGPADYRYGLIFQHWRGTILAQHAGGLPGANSAFIMAPDLGIDAIVLCNRAAPATGLALQALEIVANDALAESPTAPATTEFADLPGTYYAPDDGYLFALADQGGKLAVGLFGDKPFSLEACPANDGGLPFWADTGAAQLRFRRGSEPTSIDYFDGTQWTTACRVEFVPPAPETLIAGPLHSANASASLSIEIDRGGLVVVINGEIGSARYQAEALAPDLLRFWPPLFPGGKIARLIRDEAGVGSIIVSTPRTRAITFTRPTSVNRGA
jgi:CubicO group peptidase (beta-lactamase class C family)